MAQHPTRSLRPHPAALAAAGMVVAALLAVSAARLGGYSPAWNPVGAPAVTDYEFTLIEIRLDARGRGEGKTSVTTKVVVDNEARTVALENYAATPALLQNVSR